MAVGALVTAGASSLVNVKSWVVVPVALVAVMVIGKLPPLPAVDVPARVAVPSPLSVKVIPAGSAPVSVTEEAGSPVVVTVEVNGVPTVEVAAAALMMVGATCSVTTNGVPGATEVHVDS